VCVCVFCWSSRLPLGRLWNWLWVNQSVIRLAQELYCYVRNFSQRLLQILSVLQQTSLSPITPLNNVTFLYLLTLRPQNFFFLSSLFVKFSFKCCYENFTKVGLFFSSFLLKFYFILLRKPHKNWNVLSSFLVKFCFIYYCENLTKIELPLVPF
jgi:hypothetical protein